MPPASFTRLHDRMRKKPQHEQRREAGDRPLKNPALGIRTAAGRLAPLLIVAAGLIAYGNSYRGVFVYDDLIAIASNKQIERLSPITEALRPPPDTPVTGRPLLNLTFAVNYALDGLNPAGYHVFNLVLHLGNGLLLLGIIRRTCRSSLVPDQWKSRASGLATAVALLWIVHPLQTESVMYLTQRSELLAGMFYLLTLYAALRAEAAPPPPDAGKRSARRRAWVLSAIAACTLGVLCKELLVTAPVMVVLYHLTFGVAPIHEKRGWTEQLRRTLRRNWDLYLGLTATWLVIALLLRADPRGGTVGFDRGIAALDYLCTQAGVIVHYLRLVFWPSPLVICYADWPIARTFAECWLPGLVVLSLLGGTIVAIARRSWLGFAGAWFFGILAPTSSFVPIITEVAAERRMYLPLAAVILVVVGAAWRVANLAFERFGVSPRSRRWLGGASLVLLAIAFASATLQRNRDYHDAIVLWQGVIAERPNSAAACNGLGSVLAIAGRHEEAVEAYRRALQIDPSQRQAQSNLGTSLSRLGRFDEAADEYRKALRLAHDSRDVLYGLARALEQSGRLDEARAAYREILDRQPADLPAQFGLALCLQKQGATVEALEAYRRALAIDSRHADSRCNLALALLALGQETEAVSELRLTLEGAPRHLAALYGLANALLAQGRYAEAVTLYQRALDVDPRHLDARCNLGIGLKQLGRVEEARAALLEVLRLRPAHIIARYNLAALLEGEGRLDEAVAQYRQILTIQPDYAPARAALDAALSRREQVNP